MRDFSSILRLHILLDTAQGELKLCFANMIVDVYLKIGPGMMLHSASGECSSEASFFDTISMLSNTLQACGSFAPKDPVFGNGIMAHDLKHSA